MSGLGSRLVRFAYDHRHAVTWLIPPGATLPVRVPGFTILVRCDDWAVGMRIAVKRRFESHVSEAFRRALAPGMTVVDVGANVGWYTLLAASVVGHRGRVVAIEASAANVELLRRSVAMNGFGNVEVIHAAVSDREGELRYHADDSNGFVATPDEVPGGAAVRAAPLDRLLADEPRVDVVKMDIEGSEGRALAGMTVTLARHRPLVFTEFSAGALRLVSKMEPADVLAAWRRAGYALRVQPRSGDAASEPQDDATILAALPGRGAEHHVDLIASPAR